MKAQALVAKVQFSFHVCNASRFGVIAAQLLHASTYNRFSSSVVKDLSPLAFGSDPMFDVLPLPATSGRVLWIYTVRLVHRSVTNQIG
jgi:hypothetical protein